MLYNIFKFWGVGGVESLGWDDASRVVHGVVDLVDGLTEAVKVPCGLESQIAVDCDGHTVIVQYFRQILPDAGIFQIWRRAGESFSGQTFATVFFRGSLNSIGMRYLDLRLGRQTAMRPSRGM